MTLRPRLARKTIRQWGEPKKTINLRERNSSASPTMTLWVSGELGRDAFETEALEDCSTLVNDADELQRKTREPLNGSRKSFRPSRYACHGEWSAILVFGIVY